MNFVVDWDASPISHTHSAFLLGSMGLHIGYVRLLVASYGVGDLSQVYPIARGLAPIVVALLSARFAGEVPDLWLWAALVLVSVGIMSLAWSPGPSSARSRAAVGLALLNGVTIGCYTFVDGQGVRVAGSALTYVMWQGLTSALPWLGFAVFRHGGIPRAFLRAEGRNAILAGALAMVSYGIVIWAMSVGSMAIVSSLRETSVIFGALIGTLVLGERFGRHRVMSAIVVALGIALLNLYATSSR